LARFSIARYYAIFWCDVLSLTIAMLLLALFLNVILDEGS